MQITTHRGFTVGPGDAKHLELKFRKNKLTHQTANGFWVWMNKHWYLRVHVSIAKNRCGAIRNRLSQEIQTVVALPLDSDE